MRETLYPTQKMVRAEMLIGQVSDPEGGGRAGGRGEKNYTKLVQYISLPFPKFSLY